MAKIIRFHAYGGPEVLRYEVAEVGDPGPGQVRLVHGAVALNFADTYFRSGQYPVPLPSGIGSAASGSVTALGAGVTALQVGDRVTYTGAHETLGAYSTERLIDARVLIRLPPSISFETAAAITMRGLTAAYLLRRLHAFQPGDALLLHAAAGGVGLLVAQWARLLGLRVIGTVSSEAKAEAAKAHGCEHTIDYRHENVAQRVREITGGQGVSVVFDSVGRDTFEGSLDSLQRRGLMVCLGTASGPIAAFDPQLLARKGSLFLTRPAAADYLADPADKAALVKELFAHVTQGRIRAVISRRYALAQAAQAHRDLEARKIIGSAIFML